MPYSKELRETVVKKALAGEQNQDAIAEEFGVGRSTVQNWLRQHRATGEKMSESREKRPQDWSPEERLQALVESEGLSEVERGAWCRRHGLHTHHLVQWRRDLLAGSGGSAAATGPAELRRLREENKALRKDLRRMEAALAETSALLVLKKKAGSIWGENEVA